MASTSASSVQKSFKYDVFLSFRGEDTRKGFVDHLYHALSKRGIITYKDDKEIVQGERISEQLIRSIQDSRFYIIVFSKNYASSSWCLDELVQIMECQKTAEHTAYPVFYDVEPTEVRHQSGAVREAFAKVVGKGKRKRTEEDADVEEKEAAGKWKDALKEAAGLAGWELKNTLDGHEAKFIEKIMEEILPKLYFINLSIDENLVGMEVRVNEIVSSLEIGLDSVRMIGIKGIGGGGKTTLANAVFDHISGWFEGVSFVENVREVSKSSLNGLKELQKKVLSDVLNDQTVVVKSVSEGKNKIKRMMGSRKVLLVLDDVDDISQLEALAGKPTWFKQGSRIIITTRDEQVLTAHRVNFIHDVNLLSHEEAICLFNRHAFDTEIPPQGYEELSQKFVHYAAGLPLTLKVLGSHLCGRTEPEWVDAIERLKTIPLKETLKRLEISYDGLEDDQKEIFLDVACLLKGKIRGAAIRTLESRGFYAEIGLKVLEQKSLLTVSPFEQLQMHDHLEEMGKNIVRRSHPEEPNKHSRLWFTEEIDDILANDSGTNGTASLISYYSRSPLDIIMTGLRKIKDLRVLFVYSDYDLVDIPDPVNQYLPNTLQSLFWYCYPFACLPKTFQANNLVHLEMYEGNLAQLWEWGEKKVLNKLKFLVLYRLDIRSFDMGMTPNLQVFHLEKCMEFVELRMPVACPKLKNLIIRKSKVSSLKIGLAPCLEKLSITECFDLVELQMPAECPKLKLLNLWGSKVSSLNIGSAPCLETLDLENSKDLVELHIPVKFLNLEHLDLCGSKVSSLNIGSAPCLKTLNLENCNDLVELHIPVEFPKLKSINLCGSKVRSLNIGSAPCLEMLALENCDDLVELHMPVEFPKLEYLNLCSSKVSSLNIVSAPCLEMLDLGNCNDLVELHIPVECPKLELLDLCGSKVSSLNIRSAPCLEILNLANCNNLVEVHILVELQKLKVLNLICSKVSNVNLELTPHLERLDLKNCYFLQEIHNPVGCLRNLVYLDLSDCSRFEYCLIDKGSKLNGHDSVATTLNLTAESLDTCPLHPDSNLPKFRFKCLYDEDLPSSSGNLEKLLSFGLCACTNLESFSASICGLQGLKKLTLEGSIPEVPKDLYLLESLEHLTLSMKEITHLPDSLRMLKHLKSLNLSYCQFLEQLPKDIGRLEGLEELRLRDCMSLRDIPKSICKMKSLRYLDLCFCILVEKLPEEIGRLESLGKIDIEGAGVRRLPQSIFELKGLYIFGSVWQFESYGFTATKEISTDRDSWYIIL